MSESMVIEAEWLPADHGSAEERATAAELRISLGEHVVTTVDSSWANSVRDKVRVSVWPLAVWFASSWWRLRWEAESEVSKRNTSFLQSHEMVSAGSGYVWPRLSFRTDGERIDIVSRQSQRHLSEPVRYLVDWVLTVQAEAFELSVSKFVETVISRLDDEGIRNSFLHDLWREVLEEKSDPDTTEYRKLEARLGFDPDEADADLIEAFEKLRARAGSEAASEIANMGFPQNPKSVLGGIDSVSQSQGITGSFDAFGEADFVSRRKRLLGEAPWTRGRQLARDVRANLGLDGQAISDERLSELVGITRGQLTLDPTATVPIGLAVRRKTNNKVQLYFRRKNLAGRRFEAARFVADHLVASLDDRWLPLTDSDTARQKTQRAFAAEFLAPIESIKSRLAGNFSEEAIDEVATDFGVSSLSVWSSLVNNGVISRDGLGGFSWRGARLT